jgi:heptosyltransferase-3
LQREIQRILIVRTDRIGDVILTLPMARVLKQHFPSVHVSMLIQQYTAELVEDDPSVDQIVHYDNGGYPLPFFRLLDSMREGKFDVVFHTHPRFRLALITWLARIPLRVGTGYRWYSFLFNKKVYEHRKDAQRHELEYNLNLLKAVDCPEGYEKAAPTLQIPSSATESVTQLVRSLGIPQYNKIAIIHPGSGGSSRDWSAENFGELGKRIGGLANVSVIVTGGKGEDELVKRVQSIVGHSCITIVNRLTLGEFAALAKMAALFISNSTGTIHIAAAVGTPVIGLYPHLVPLSAARWGPYTERKVIFSPLNHPLNCTRCTGEKGSYCECMNSISVDEVFATASHMLLGEQMSYTDSLLDKRQLQGDKV